MTMAARSGERLERGRAGGVDREHAVQAGDRENALHGAAGDDQGHGPVGAVHAAHAADEHAERRGVDERDAAQVDDQPVDARVEELQHAFLELRSGVDVDFAGEGDDTESVALSGEVDIYTAPQFKECMLELLDAGVDRLVVDLSGVTFIDSTARLVTTRAMAPSALCTRRTPPMSTPSAVERVLSITGLDRVFTIHATRAAALESLA